jgi:tRNA (mo5U34)-methyltransferase
MSNGNNLKRGEIERRIEELGPWFHNMNLGGVMTAPNHFLGDYPSLKWRRFSHAIESDLRGRTVLDVGCNGGFYSIEMKRRGADLVVGIDTDPDYLKQARFAAEVCGAELDLREMSIYEVEKLNRRFDIVLCLGVFYHLRYPLLALDMLHRYVVGDTLIFQSMVRGSYELEPVAPDYPFAETEIFNREGFPKMHFIEHNYSGDPTNWWIPNRACVEALLRTSGFVIVNRPEEEVYICRRAERVDSGQSAAVEEVLKWSRP